MPLSRARAARTTKLEHRLIFKGGKGAALRRNNFHRSARWSECVAGARLPEGFRFHDLRHTGNTLAAWSGASTRELMHRMAREHARCIDQSARQFSDDALALIHQVSRGLLNCELCIETPPAKRVAAAFAELAHAS